TPPRPPTSTLFPYTTLFRSASTALTSMPRVHRPASTVRSRARSRGHKVQMYFRQPGYRIQHMVLGEPPRSPTATARPRGGSPRRSEEHTSELQSRSDLVCRL